MAREKKQSKAKLRRAQRAELIAPKTTRRTNVSRAAAKRGKNTWRTTKRFLGKRYDIPMPNNRIGQILGREIRMPRYFRESWEEVKKVKRPSRHEARRLTVAVFVFTTVFALFTALVDFIFSNAVERILLR